MGFQAYAANRQRRTEGSMRLKPEKIENLAGVIYAALAANNDLTLTESRETISGLIRQVITEDLKTEDEIEAEAHHRLEQFKEEITKKGASYEKLFLKAKQKIAQERKMVL